MAGLGKLAWRGALREVFFSENEEQVQAFDRRPALHDSLCVECEFFDINQALRMCEDRQEADACEVSCVSWATLTELRSVRTSALFLKVGVPSSRCFFLRFLAFLQFTVDLDNVARFPLPSSRPLS